MKRSVHKLKQRILTPLGLTILFLSILAVISIYWLQKKHIDNSVQSRAIEFKRIFYEKLDEEASVLSAQIDFLSDNLLMQSAFLSRNRETLQDVASPLLTQFLSFYRVTHFSIYEPDATCFLQVHAPAGNEQAPKTRTLERAAQTLVSVSGIELDESGTINLRVIHPWLIDGHLSGFIELAMDVSHMIPAISRALDIELIVTVDKKYIKKDKWEEGRQLFGKKGNWDEFSDIVVLDGTLPDVPEKIGLILNKSDAATIESIDDFTIDSRIFCGGITNLFDISGKTIGKIAILKDITDARMRLKRMTFIIIGAFGVTGGCLLVLFYIYIHHIQQALVRKDGALRREIVEKEAAREDLRKEKDKAENYARKADAANKAKSEFVSNISHEIRTPMNAIIGMSDLALSSNLTNEQREYLEIVKSSANALMTLLNDVLDFSKIEAGRMDFESIDFNLRDLIESAAKSLATQAHKKGLELICSMKPDMPPWFKGDPHRLRQVLTNLIGNAVKFTDQGEIIVSAEFSAYNGVHPVVRFSVSDTGIGMTDEEQSVVFERFTQADGSTTRRFGGTGLGLAISRQLVELMGGEIGVQSAYGKGTTFQFSIPMPVGNPCEYPRNRDRSRLNGLKVLIVDDNAANLKILKETLFSYGVAAIGASAAYEGLQKLEDIFASGGHCDICLLDYHMPGLNGMELAQIIRRNSIWKKMPILFLTSTTTMDFESVIRKLDRSAHLLKPVSRDDLVDSILELTGDSRTVAETTAPDQPAAAVKKDAYSILLAEDNPLNQKLAQSLLAKKGHRVVVAGDGQSALEAFNNSHFDLVLMDVQMPDMDGFEVTKKMREIESSSGRRTPIVAITAHAMAGFKEKCLNAGMDEFVSKPIDAMEFYEKIDKTINGGIRAEV